MIVLGIETSCDETAIALYDGEKKSILAHEIYSQVEKHALFGGVVPEIASRDHLKKTIVLIESVLTQAKLKKEQINAIAYTKGPGLMGALFIGACVGRSLGYALNIPCIGVHHMEAHLFAAMIETPAPSFPFIALLVSGGHTQLVAIHGLGSYQLLGESIDDAVGEAFDKVGLMLDLPYPGGPHIERLAKEGNAKAFAFPRPMMDRPGLDFSFSGLKTACRRAIQQGAARYTSHDLFKADIAASFQSAVVDTLVQKCKRAVEATGIKALVIAGGVGANQHLRTHLGEKISTLGGQVYYPRPEFCTDNGVMIAHLGFLRLSSCEQEGLAVKVFPRWPIENIR